MMKKVGTLACLISSVISINAQIIETGIGGVHLSECYEMSGLKRQWWWV